MILPPIALDAATSLNDLNSVMMTAGLVGLHHPSVKEEAAFRKKEACNPQYPAILSRQIYCTSCFYISENAEEKMLFFSPL